MFQLRKYLCLLPLSILIDGSFEEEWSYDPEVRVSVVDNIIKIGDCCPIYGGPNFMRVASIKGENLLGMTGLGILHLDVDSKAKKLIPMLPSKKRVGYQGERCAKGPKRTSARS